MHFASSAKQQINSVLLSEHMHPASSAKQQSNSVLLSECIHPASSAKQQTHSVPVIIRMCASCQFCQTINQFSAVIIMYTSCHFCWATNQFSTSCSQNVCILPVLPKPNQFSAGCYQNVCFLLRKKKKQKVVKNVQKWQTWCYMRILSSMAICKILNEMKSLILSFAKFFQYKCKINTLFSCICQTTDLKT